MKIAPKIMTAIVGKVLSLSDEVQDRASSYIDDIFVTGGSGRVEMVRQHLGRFGLVTKEAEHLGHESSVRVLGLSVDKKLAWSRDSKLPKAPIEGLTRRALHSWIGELMGDFPVASWI